MEAIKEEIRQLSTVTIIAETTAKACSLGGSHHRNSSSSNEPSSIIGFLRQLLKQRHDAVVRTPLRTFKIYHRVKCILT